jgi:hypothetical protein
MSCKAVSVWNPKGPGMLPCNNNQPAPYIHVSSFLPQILSACRNASCCIRMSSHVYNMAYKHRALVSRLLCTITCHCRVTKPVSCHSAPTDPP